MHWHTSLDAFNGLKDIQAPPISSTTFTRTPLTSVTDAVRCSRLIGAALVLTLQPSSSPHRSKHTSPQPSAIRLGQ
jgi:hypothetical protein